MPRGQRVALARLAGVTVRREELDRKELDAFEKARAAGVIELCDGAHERLQVYGYRKDGRWPEPGREPRGREYYDGDMPSGLWAIVQDVLHPRPAPADAGALDGTRSGLRRKEETKWRRSQETGRSPRRGKSTGCPAR
jgi:hypothetical protein